MSATLFTSGAGNICNSTTRINNKSETLWRSPDPKPCGIVTVAKEIVVEAHAGVWPERVGSVEMATGITADEGGGGVWVRREKEGEEHGVAVAAAVGRSEDEGGGLIEGDT